MKKLVASLIFNCSFALKTNEQKVDITPLMNTFCHEKHPSIPCFVCDLSSCLSLKMCGSECSLSEKTMIYFFCRWVFPSWCLLFFPSQVGLLSWEHCGFWFWLTCKISRSSCTGWSGPHYFSLLASLFWWRYLKLLLAISLCWTRWLQQIKTGIIVGLAGLSPDKRLYNILE